MHRNTYHAAGRGLILQLEGPCDKIAYSPGPKYKLKTLVGYEGHCISTFRNPAYTFGKRVKHSYETVGPGPKYMPKERRREGYTIGMAAIQRVITTGPGMKYTLPVVRGPSFSMKWRTKQRKVDETPGPGYVKPITDAPVFTIGLRWPAMKVKASAGPYTPYDLDMTNPKAPAYSIARQYKFTPLPRSPGPIYDVKLPKPTPAFSFGAKHSICAPPYITECDEQC
ncbi:outer dense fiber protein 3-like isoform X2 [Odontomachus brunneus]|uniref:outer dense fiber protein 3-like isoform X2 n=1 Tax=Odontomachus brunneus TaxID=486640 RepID=UPI0013F1EB08|nr:outer dense fiber protein 3-like isoform X2 [Odontomachus brunneus]